MQTMGEFHELKSNILENEEYIPANIKEDNPEKKNSKITNERMVLKEKKRISFRKLKSKNPSDAK